MEIKSNPLETRLFQTYWDDGLLDLLCGLGLLTIALSWFGGLGPLTWVFAPLWIVMWRPLRHHLVEPHAGFVRFSQERQRRVDRDLKTTLAFGAGSLVLVAFGALIMARASQGAGSLIAGLPAALVALAAVATGLLTGARRFHLYSLALLAGAGAVGLLAGEPEVPILAGGLIVSATGAFLLARFIRDSEAYGDGS